VIAPEAPEAAADVVPELNSRVPLLPEDAELADTTKTAPEEDGPAPDSTCSAPPPLPLALVLPANMYTSPPSPPVFLPTTTLMEPAAPLVAVPVPTSTKPVLLDDPDVSPELNTMDPLLLLVAPPDIIRTEPVSAAESPEDSTKDPLVPDPVLPVAMVTFPRPLPLDDVPLLKVKVPLSPAVAAFPDLTITLPLVPLVVDLPDTMSTPPPVELEPDDLPPCITIAPPAVVTVMPPAVPVPEHTIEKQQAHSARMRASCARRLTQPLVWFTCLS
jgi:hypothetical protein